METIGDCYVACTGLPRAQEDHAARMAKFAAACALHMPKVCHRLLHTLGDDTGDLQLRVGMHSGPVTAGVLRGAKARFQLFGDTVNTAARMESTGMPRKIQVSEATATELEESGHGDWIRPRAETVQAKGKGTLQTYWLELRAVLDRSTTSGGSQYTTDDSALSSNINRSQEFVPRSRTGTPLTSFEASEDEDDAECHAMNLIAQPH